MDMLHKMKREWPEWRRQVGYFAAAMTMFTVGTLAAVCHH